MDVKRLDEVITKIANMDSEQFEELSEGMQLIMERGLAKEEDDRAFVDIGLERITIFLAGGHRALLVKPNKAIGEMWLLNIYGSGSINIKSTTPEFKIMDIGAGSAMRFFVKAESMEYWVDLIDEQQAKDLAEFLSVGIED